MSQAPDPTRWKQADSGVPAELSALIREGQNELGSPEEVAELGARLALVLGPEAGLSAQPAQQPAAPAPAPKWPASSGAHALGRLGRWLAAGATAATSVWLVASALSGRPAAAPPAAVAERSAAAPDSLAPRPLLRSTPTLAAPDAAPPIESAPAPGAQQPPRAHTDAPPTPRSASSARGSQKASGEAALLERARAALRVDPARALALAEQHQRRYPHGALGQEREVIAIEALQRLGRADAASARAAAFEHRYRDSVHRPRLERTTDSASPPPGTKNSDR